jgi:hypothetical protein
MESRNARNDFPMRIVLLSLALAATLNAAPLTWVLENAAFTDGGTATGWFVFDADTEQVLSYSILTSGGNTSVFPAFLFQNGAPDNLGAYYDPYNGGFMFDSSFTNGYPDDLQLRLAPVGGVLTDAGGVLSLDLNSPWQAECYNCSPYRVFQSGELSSTPEPGSGLMALLAAALTLAGRQASRRARG